ncbi:MAG: YadA-like family protein [Moraxella sp.]
MNKVYRLVWNKATQTWNAVSEYAKSQGKSSNAVIMPSLKGAYRVMRTFMRFAYTALMSALLLLSGRAAIAVTGTTTSSGTSVTNAGSHNTCYYDTTTQSVVCGDASTKVPGVYGSGTSSAPSRISQSVVLGQGAEVADSFSRESSTDTIMHSHAVVIGQTAKANGYQSVAVGANSETSRRSTALGFGAKAGGHNKTTAAPDGELYGVAIGYKADAPRHHSIAIGAEAKVDAIATTDKPRSDAILQSDSGNGLIDGATSASDSAGAMALGRGTKANGYAAIAHGLNAEATAAFSTAIGANSKADKMETIALGSRAEATGHHAISIGSSFKQDGATKASGENSIAIGTKAESATNNAIAIGTNTKSTSLETIAVGNAADVGGSQFGIAIGSGAKLNNDATVTGKNTAIAIGYQAEATELDANAFGRKANATGRTSLAIGAESASKGESSIAVGSTAIAAARDGIAIGNTAKTGTGDNNTAVGSYSEANNGWSTALGTRAYTNANGALAAGTMASAEGQRATAIGSFSFAEGLTSTALGYNAIATKTAVSGTAMGTGTVIDGQMSGAWAAAPHANPHQYDNTKRSIVGGEGNYAIGNENIVGNLTKNSVVFGNKIKIGAEGATLTTTNPAGQGNSIKSREEEVTYINAKALENAVAIGNSSKVTVSNGVALGSNSVANVDKEEEGSDPLNAVTNKQNSTWKATHAAVSVGDGTDVTRQITSVAAGKNDTDAVNVAQLKAAGFELSVSETGGGISEDKTQTSNLSDKKVKNGETVTVDAGKNIKVTQTGKTVSIATKDEVGFTKITLGDATNNTVLTSTANGLDVGGDKITNVANGTADTDAVNVSQLKAAQAAATSKVAAGNGISVTPVVDATTGSTTYTVAADTTTLNVGDGTSGNPAGKVIAPTGADVNKLATAGDIANAINKSGFQATAGGNLASGTNATPTTVKPGQKVTFAAGNGLTVKQDVDANGDQSYTYAVNAQTVVQDAQLPVVYTKADGTKVYKRPDGKFYDAPTGGNEVAAGDVIASMQDAAGSTTALTTLANVKSNLADAGNAVTNPAGNSRADLAGKGNNAATVNDVLNSGFTVQGNGQNKDFVTHGDTINFANGQGTVANVTSTNGVTTVKFDTPMTYADASGNPTSTPSNKVNLVGGDATKPVTLGNVADGTVAAGSKEAVNGGQLHATNQNVANNATNIAKGINFGGTTGSNNYQLGDTINVKGDSNITSTTVAGGAQLALNPNLNVTSVTTTDAAGNKTVTNGSGVTITPASGNPVSLTTGGLNNGGNKITNVKAGEDDTDAVNVSQLKAAQAAAKTTATAGKNITVKPTTNPDGSTNYEIATKDDVTFSKTTVGNVITDGATGKITGLTAGDVSKTSTDAVNGSQLHAHGAGVKNIIGGNTTYNPATGNYTNADIGGTGKDNIDAAIKAVKTEVKAGDNIAVTSNVDADGKTTYTVATKKDLVVDSVKVGDKVTLNNAGLTAGNVSVTTGGINAGNTIITNVQSGLNGKTLEQIKTDPNATERNNAATIGDLATVQNNVTNINNNYNTVVNKVIGGTTPDGKVTDANGKIVKDNKGNAVNASDALKTYNVSGNHAKTDNTLITAIKNINEGGIKFFHVNDGTGNQNVTGSDTHAEDSAASGNFAAAVGYQAKASGANAIAFGNGAEAAAKNAISIGTGNKVSGENSGAIGDPSIITGNNSYSVGNNNTVSTNNTFVLGNNVTQTVDNSVFLGNNAASTGVHTTANGGNYTYAGMNDAGVSGVSDVVGVVSVGKEGETRQIQNVAAGVVSATSTDAINGSQLYATAEGLAGTTINMGNQLNNRINEVKDDANAGVSSAMAMAALPQAYIPGKSMLTGGMATYNGQGAVAVGLSKLSDNGRWVLKVSGSADTKGNAGGAVGAGFHF